jgi:hypothetical protein
VKHLIEALKFVAKDRESMVITMKMLFKLKGAGAVLLAIVFLILSMSASVLAASTIDMNRLGSITINLSEDDLDTSEILSGIPFTIYKVAKLSNSGEYSLTEDFTASGIQINKLSTAAELLAASKNLVQYVSAKNISGSSKTTDSEGSVTFKDLTLGYYLVMQTVNASNQNYYIVCDPFLIPVPIENSSNKNWIYDINAYPKSETVHGAVIIEKVNSSSALLAGAVFRLERKIYYTDITVVPSGAKTGSDSNGNYYWNEVISALTTNSNGQIAIKNMQLGQYRIIETKAPAGYDLNSSPQEFSISAAGSVKQLDGRYVIASGSVQTLKVLNYYTYIYYYNTPTPTPTPTPTVSPTPTKDPKVTPETTSIPVVPTVTKALEENVIEEDEVPLGNNNITPTDPPKSIEKSTGFDLPKTGGSVSYAVCTYGGAGLIICGAAVFVISRIKKP